MPTRPSDNSALARALRVLSEDVRGAHHIVVLRHQLSLHPLTGQVQLASLASAPWAVIWSALAHSIHFYGESSNLFFRLPTLFQDTRALLAERTSASHCVT